MIKSKMKIKHLIAFGLLSSCGPVLGSVTLSFSTEPVSGLSDILGVPSNNLFYGVIIDAASNGFSGSYSEISLTLNGVYILNSSTTSLATDDVLILAGFRTFDAGEGNGGIFDVGPFDFLTGLTGGAAVQANDVFRLVWISGNAIGTLADNSFTVPSDGSLQDYTLPFVGTDPARSAGLSYLGTSSTSTGPGFAFVAIPEPSALLLGAFGALGLLRRRRN